MDDVRPIAKVSGLPAFAPSANSRFANRAKPHVKFAFLDATAVTDELSIGDHEQVRVHRVEHSSATA
jgi:hypothetical protein